MIHGHAKIELTDVNTGDVQVIEKDNMLTNWLRDVVTPRGVWADCISTMTFWSSASNMNKDFMFSGLMMFEDTLSVSADDYKFPFNNKMIAHADNQLYNSIDYTRGNYNSSLTTSGADSSTFVWDFDQEHGNGTISSLGLCNRVAGLAGSGTDTINYNCPLYGSNTNENRAGFYRQIGNRSNSQASTIYVDDLTCRIYGIKSFSAGVLTLNVMTYPYSEFDPIHDAINNTRQITTSTASNDITVDISSYQTGNTAPPMVVVNGELWMFTPIGIWTDGASRTIVKYKFSDGTITTQSVTNNTGVSLSCAGDNSFWTGGGYQSQFGVYNGVLYAVGDTSKRLYYIDLTDNTDCGVLTYSDGVTEVVFNGSTSNNSSYHCAYTGMSGDLYMCLLGMNSFGRSGSNYSSDPLVRLTSKTTVGKLAHTLGRINYNTSYTVYYNNVMGGNDARFYSGSNQGGGNATYLYLNYNLLCLTTKCNLDSPITKTSSQTMRVTYTIQSDNS